MFTKKNLEHCKLTKNPQDYPTIRFNAKESVEMPFRKPIDFAVSKLSFNSTVRKATLLSMENLYFLQAWQSS